jgi:hypothetical protein
MLVVNNFMDYYPQDTGSLVDQSVRESSTYYFIRYQFKVENQKETLK